MVDFGTNQKKFDLYLVKNICLFCEINHLLSFGKKFYGQASKYVVVTGVYPSRIGFNKGIVA